MIKSSKYLALLFIMLLSSLMVCAQRTILWKVTNNKTKKVSYLLGTCHQLGNSYVDSLPGIKDVLIKSEVVIFEALHDKGTLVRSFDSRPDNGIKRKLGTKYYRRLERISKNWNVNIHKVQPIELRWKLNQEYTKHRCQAVKLHDKWDHFESYLEHLARAKSIEVMGMETYKEQLALINREHKSPSWKQEKKRIKYLIDLYQSNKVSDEKCKLVRQFRAMRFDYKFDQPCATNVLIKERNENWMKSLPDLLYKKNCFVVVGLYHLYYDCGIINQLRSEDFSVEPVPLDPPND